MSNVDFAKGLRSELSKQGVKVASIVTTEEDLLEDLVNNPNVDGVLLKSDLAIKLGEARLEILVDVIEGIRKAPQFKDIVFTVLSDEKIGHPFLAEIVELGVYNIFVKGQSKFTISSIINTFESPRSFSSAAIYKNVDSSVPWRRNLTKNSTVNLNFELNKSNESIESAKQKDGKNGFFQLLKQANSERGKKIKPSLTEMELEQLEAEVSEVNKPLSVETVPEEKPIENFEDIWLKDKDIVRPLIVGTVVIGVAGVASSSGCTNTAINVAKFLTEMGYQVGLVECNTSMDFDRIHSLSEGEKHNLKSYTYSLKGIEHYKYRENLNINEIFTNFEYVVLDFGELKYSPLYQEFYRAHIKLVCCSADEWKFYLIENFLIEHEVSDLKFVVPGASVKWLKDLEGRLKGNKVYPIGVTDSPYLLSTESENTYKNLFAKYFKPQQKRNVVTLAITSFISIITTVLVLMWLL